jgi:glycosyltransferase involved in cell wall biosynthesis
MKPVLKQPDKQERANIPSAFRRRPMPQAAVSESGMGLAAHRVSGDSRPGASPRVLLVDSSLAGNAEPCRVWDDVIDYRALASVPRWLRWGEGLSRLDVSLAWRARRIATGFDLLVAGSEKVGIPLACVKPSRPVVCVVHQIASPQKRRLLKLLNVPAGWMRVGYQCNADRDLLTSYYGVPASRLIKFKAAPLRTFTPAPASEGRYVLSVGTSKRDYATFFSAIQSLSDIAAHVYASSRYFDPYRGSMPLYGRQSIAIKDHVSNSLMPDVYRSARFVVLPLEDTYQYSAGATVALEAHAAGKAIVATRTHGMSDYVIDGVTGFIVPPGDTGAMRNAIARLWNDPRLAREMGMAGRAHVEKEFNPDIVDEEIRCAYVQACEEYRSLH